MTSQSFEKWENKSMTVMDTHRKNSAKVWYDILRINDDQGSRRKIVMKDKEASRKRTHFSTIASGAATIGSAGHAPHDIIK
jgi:hypothetical protein